MSHNVTLLIAPTMMYLTAVPPIESPQDIPYRNVIGWHLLSSLWLDAFAKNHSMDQDVVGIVGLEINRHSALLIQHLEMYHRFGSQCWQHQIELLQKEQLKDR
jgi:hypothetical protein